MNFLHFKAGEQAPTPEQAFNPHQLAHYTSPEFRDAVAGIEDPDVRMELFGDLSRLHQIGLDGLGPEFGRGVARVSQALKLADNDRSVGALAFTSAETWTGGHGGDAGSEPSIGLGETLAAFFANPQIFAEGYAAQSERPLPPAPGDDPEFTRLGKLLGLV